MSTKVLSSPAEAGPGSGIGLAVAAELVAAHGGSIRAGNRDEGGAVFTVRLPVVSGTSAGP